MQIEAVVKRIGGSVFLRLPSDVARSLELEEGQTLKVEVKRPMTGAEVARFFRDYTPPNNWKPNPNWTFDRRELWGDED